MLRKAILRAAGMFRGRDATIQQGVGKGLKFNTGDSNVGYVLGTAEPQLQEAFARAIRPGMVVYDVGANVGFHAVLACKLVGPSGRVFAFEPLPENFKTLQHNFQLNRFDHAKAFDLALGDSDGHAELQLAEDPNWASLRRDDDGQSYGSVRVEVRSLDSLIESDKLPDPDVMKIDIESGETLMLPGARETIARAKPLLFIDLHGTNREVADFLEPLGYDILVLGQVNTPVRDAEWYVQMVALPERFRSLRSTLESI